VKIYYSDGKPFNGNFTLSIYKVYVVSGTTSNEYVINGEKSYTWN